MNLYLLERTDQPGFDEYLGAVVAAPNPAAARLTHPHCIPGWDGVEGARGTWASADTLKVTKVGKAYKQPAGVVLASFNAG